MTRQMASYRDLDSYLSCDDALILLEMLRTKDYNEWLFNEAEAKKIKE